MSASPEAKTAPGRPFVKGDPRINRNRGPLNVEAQVWGLKAKNALAKKLPPDVWADVVAKKANAGIPWAVQLYRDTFVESVAQKHDLSGEVTATWLKFDFGDNGNGKDHE